MNTDYADLKSLLTHRGYQKLQALWALEYGEVMKGLQKAAARNNEANWRYKAGELKGFDLAVGQLDRALLALEKEGESPDASPIEGMSAAEILKELKGEK